MLSGVFFIVALATTLAVVLVLVHKRLAGNESALIDEIEARLPRIHCAQCGYPGCRPYAEALAHGDAAINLCPPGGEQTIRSLAELLGQDPEPLDMSRGAASIQRVARIDEPDCIGCNLCLQACPVDAIIGVPQTMHTVLANLCTGCELCIPPCPVDCIKLVQRHA